MRPTRKLILGVGALFLITCAGTLGYMLLEGWSFSDALYMTIITITTVGYREVQVLTPADEPMTMVLVVFGVCAVLVVFGIVTVMIGQGELIRHFGSIQMDAKIARLSGHTIICGGGRVASLIAEGLAMRRRPFVLIESDEARARKLIERGWTTLVGDATEEEVLKSAGLARAVTVLPALPSDAGNIFITLIARSEKPGITIIARAETDSARSKLHKAGADQVVQPHSTSASQFLGLLLQTPEELHDLDAVVATFAEIGITPRIIPVTGESRTLGQCLAAFPDIDPALTAVVAVMRSEGGEIVPRPADDLLLHPGDHIATVSAPRPAPGGEARAPG